MKFKLSTFVLAMTVFAIHANAGTVTIQFNTNGGNSYAGYATYPYFGTADGKPMTFMCDSFNQHIVGGESWQADVLTVAQYGATLTGGVQEADRIAYLFTQAVANGGVNPLFNAAAWVIKEGAPDISGDLSAMAMVNSVDAMTFSSGAFNNVRFYVPVNFEGEQPQTFVGTSATPEPSSMLLLGSGLVGLAGWARRKIA